MKTIEIIGGGTVYHVRNHLALTAPAYGNTARYLQQVCFDEGADHYDINLHLTKMANQGQGDLETNEDISKLLDKLIANPDTRIIFFNPALVDYAGYITKGGPAGYEWNDNAPTNSGKYEERLKTSEGEQRMLLLPSDKLVKKIRKERKDIFLVAFKTTCGATEDEQFLTGLHLLKSSSCNLVLANDTKTRWNMIITPEQARYQIVQERHMALKHLVQMAIARADAKFTRSTVVSGDSVSWNSSMIPDSLRKVVNHCVRNGAYKSFNGSTVGHFAVKVNDKEFITSKRKTNFNNLDDVGMVLCRAESEDKVVAFGAKPSVGGQSQRIVFKDHPEADCIVHFHCPPKTPGVLPGRMQKYFECGSHECGKNTSLGLKEVAPGIKCVYLDNHGPNIVFNRNINPQQVIDFIDENFYLSKSTDGVDRSKTRVQ
jgi:hypothetical protein